MGSTSDYVVEPDVRARCDYCTSAPGRKAIKTCGGCRIVRYCSKQCQLSAWGEHKKVCSTIPKDMAPESQEALLRKSLDKWAKQWSVMFRRWALFALNTSNNPPDHLAKHVFSIEVEQRKNPPSESQSFRMIRGAVLTRQQVMDLLAQRGSTRGFIESFQNAHKGTSIICIHIYAKGLSYFMWQGLRPSPENTEHIFINEVNDPQICATLADHTLWEPSMINTIETGDMDLTSEYLHRIISMHP